MLMQSLHRGRLYFVLFCIAACLCIPGARGQSREAPTEYQVKAAFVFNFAKFVEWPQAESTNGTAPIVVGILGEDPFGAELDRIVNDRQVNGRPLRLKRFVSLSEVNDCHMLFISSSEKQRLQTIFDSLQSKGILTIGDSENFAKEGGMINFVLEKGKVRFQINIDAAERAGIKLSSQLLKLAHIVKEKE